ncbi:hypothetical protein J2S57_001440 [Kineosporia succinea]|uniref:Uncharacterized protein n=1 Tax=Kineosporia succinea TaxID=84632 RepID=A0ABT9NZF3_9ACTN|nr:hypothetical protein [Kineosporia succinea]
MFKCSLLARSKTTELHGDCIADAVEQHEATPVTGAPGSRCGDRLVKEALGTPAPRTPGTLASAPCPHITGARYGSGPPERVRIRTTPARHPLLPARIHPEISSHAGHLPTAPIHSHPGFTAPGHATTMSPRRLSENVSRKTELTRLTAHRARAGKVRCGRTMAPARNFRGQGRGPLEFLEADRRPPESIGPRYRSDVRRPGRTGTRPPVDTGPSPGERSPRCFQDPPRPGRPPTSPDRPRISPRPHSSLRATNRDRIAYGGPCWANSHSGPRTPFTSCLGRIRRCRRLLRYQFRSRHVHHERCPHPSPAPQRTRAARRPSTPSGRRVGAGAARSRPRSTPRDQGRQNTRRVAVATVSRRTRTAPIRDTPRHCCASGG